MPKANICVLWKHAETNSARERIGRQRGVEAERVDGYEGRCTRIDTTTGEKRSNNVHRGDVTREGEGKGA